MDWECQKLVASLSVGARQLLVTRGLLACADLSHHPPSEDGFLIWETCPEHGVISADDTIYCDGSMIDGPDKRTARVGFGLAAVNNLGEVTARAFGAPPWWIDSAQPRASSFNAWCNHLVRLPIGGH